MALKGRGILLIICQQFYVHKNLLCKKHSAVNNAEHFGNLSKNL